MELEKEKEVAKRASRKAGKILMKNFRKKKKIQKKDFKELVSNVDLKAEEVITGEIRENFPDHSITSEELGTEKGEKGYTWIIDPLDGTHNYVYGQPAFGISIALAKGKEVVLGLVNLPFYDEFYLAERDKGTFLNGERIEVSDREMDEAYILYDPQLHKREDMFDNLEKVYRNSFTMRIIGCAVTDAISVAAGRAESRIWHNTKTVDVAAGTLIVEEAGGEVSDFSGNPYEIGKTEVLVTNGTIHEDLVKVLQDAI